MRPNFKHGGRIALMILGVIFLVGLFTMLLWNSLLPAIFGLPEIGIVQAIGLLILGRLFFGSFGGRGGWRREGRHMWWRKKWESMSKEEREAFRNKSWGWGKHHHGQSHCKHSEQPSDELDSAEKDITAPDVQPPEEKDETASSSS